MKEAKEIIGEAGGESPASYELANSAATTSDPMFNKELIFTLDVQKLKDNSDIYFTESFSSTSNILTMSSKGKRIFSMVPDWIMSSEIIGLPRIPTVVRSY